MCRFKSGIILKNRIYIGMKDSHSDMLEEMEIEDTYENAIKKFVRAELIPVNDEWWTDPADWKINVDQDEVPDWFELDREKYEKDFREAVKVWWDEHVLVDKKIDELSNGYYRLKRCEVKKLLKDVQIMSDSSTVQRMYDSSTVQRMSDSSTVQIMYDSSTVQRMSDSSTVQIMSDSSTVQEMYGSSTVQRMYDSSTVQRMSDSSTVQIMSDSSTVQIMSDSSTVQRMYDSSTVQIMSDSSTVQEMYGSSTVQRMYDSSIARNYSTGKIEVAAETRLEVVKHVNKETE
jgi:hypothetical protein